MIRETAVSAWHLERKNWTSFYEQQLGQQLHQAIGYINTHHHLPARLKQHFDSFFVLLRRARTRSALHPQYISLLTTLHPWPIRWGKWDVWEDELHHALPLLSAFGQMSELAEFMTYLAEIQFQTGRLDTALKTSRAALDTAWKNQTIAPWSMAGRQTVFLLSRLGHNDEARQFLQQLEKQWAEIDMPANRIQRLEAAGHLLLQRIVFLRHDGRPLEAAQRAQTLIAQLQAFPDSDQRLLASLHKDRATMLWASDQYDLAEDALNQAIAIYADLGDIYAETTARGNLGIVYWSMARLNEAESAIRQSLQLSELFNARWRVMNEIGNLCAVSFSQGKLMQALQYTEHHLTLAIDADDAAEMDRAQGNRAMVRLYLGQYDAALLDVEKTVVQLEALGLKQLLAQAYLHLSCCFYGLERREEGETAVSHAAALAAHIESPHLQGLMLRCRALFAPPAKAVALMEQALAVARQHRQRLEEAKCLLRLSVFTSGERREALWAEGSQLMHEIGAEAWLDGRSPDNPPTVAMIL